MPRPEVPQDGVIIDLSAAEQELRGQETYAREGHTARTLLRAPDLRVVLVTMKAGSRIGEHRARESVSLHAISGHVRLHVQERCVDLPAGQLLLLAQGVEHDVEAVADSALILTLGWRAEA